MKQIIRENPIEIKSDWKIYERVKGFLEKNGYWHIIRDSHDRSEIQYLIPAINGEVYLTYESYPTFSELKLNLSYLEDADENDVDEFKGIIEKILEKEDAPADNLTQEDAMKIIKNTNDYATKIARKNLNDFLVKTIKRSVKNQEKKKIKC